MRSAGVRPFRCWACRRLRVLAELVREARPRLIVEVGTAIGYSGLWIADVLRELGTGRLVTLEMDAARAAEAARNFSRAGVADRITQIIGNVRDERIGDITDPIDLLFLDGGFSNYYPCLVRCRAKLRDGALLIADNAGIGADEMADYLSWVRGQGPSRTEWFETDLPWNPRDAMEISTYRASSWKQSGNRVLTSHLAEDLGWLEDHCRQQPEQSLQTIQLRLAAALVRNTIGPYLDDQPAAPLHVAVVGGAGAGKSTVVEHAQRRHAAEANPQAGFTRHPIAYTSSNGATHLGRPRRLPRPAATPRPSPARPASMPTFIRSAACPPITASASARGFRRLGLPGHDDLGRDRLRAAPAGSRRAGRRHRLRRLRRALQRRGADAVSASCCCRRASRSSPA